jgi:hypothetical protein
MLVLGLAAAATARARRFSTTEAPWYRCTAQAEATEGTLREALEERQRQQLAGDHHAKCQVPETQSLGFRSYPAPAVVRLQLGRLIAHP